MDLGQVEDIMGVASSLYGAGAMGGVVNLISRRPAAEAEREFLVNRSSRGATDAVVWLSSAARTGWAFTLLGSAHWQQTTDVNADRWADLAGYTRAVVRPRVFWENGHGASVFATVGLTAEDREGGTINGEIVPAIGVPYVEALTTRRVDGGFVGQMTIGQRYLLNVRGAASQARHDHRFGDLLERDRHGTAFAEVTLRASARRVTAIGGLAIERDTFRPRELGRFAYTFTVPGVFAQADAELTPWLSLSGSGRVDRHSVYGTFFSPRLAGLLRAGAWTSRMSIGTGFFAASPLTEETEAAGLTRLVIPQPLRAEEGRSASLDVGRTDGPLSYTLTLFRSRVAHPLRVDRSNGLVMTNSDTPATNAGVEALVSVRRAPYAVTGSYTYVRSREDNGGNVVDSALTPRHSAGVVAMWEREDVGRIGVETYYTGVQRVEENPFRASTKPYVIVGLLAERQFGRVRLFINGENLTGVRQTRFDPLIRPSQAADGRWTVDAWAPLDGRTVNGGLRVRF
jgi:iron complex outermembrane receptor protein